MLTLIALSTLVALVAYDFTRQNIFKEVRDFICKMVTGTIFHEKVEKLVTCHFCFSHWVAAGVLAFAGGWHLSVTGIWLDWPITWSLMVAVAQPIMVVMDWTIDAMDSFFRVFKDFRPENEKAASDARELAEEKRVHQLIDKE